MPFLEACKEKLNEMLKELADSWLRQHSGLWLQAGVSWVCLHASNKVLALSVLPDARLE